MPLLDENFTRHTIFNGLTPQQIQSLNECATEASYNPGDYIFERGKVANRFFLIKSGKINLEIYTPELGAKTIQTCGPGELVGTSWLATQSTWKLDARAATDLKVIVFNAYRMLDKCEKDLELGYALMSRFLLAISERLEASQKHILALVQELTH